MALLLCYRSHACLKRYTVESGGEYWCTNRVRSLSGFILCLFCFAPAWEEGVEEGREAKNWMPEISLNGGANDKSSVVERLKRTYGKRIFYIQFLAICVDWLFVSPSFSKPSQQSLMHTKKSWVNYFIWLFLYLVLHSSLEEIKESGFIDWFSKGQKRDSAWMLDIWSTEWTNELKTRPLTPIHTLFTGVLRKASTVRHSQSGALSGTYPELNMNTPGMFIRASLLQIWHHRSEWSKPFSWLLGL